MAIVRGRLPHPNNMRTQPEQPAANHYLNHNALADMMAQHGAVMCRQPQQGECVCCGVMPDTTLWQVEVQTQPDQEFVQIGIPRCQQILAAALRVRQQATLNATLKVTLAALERALGVIPRRDEILLMGRLLRARLTAAEITQFDAYLATV